MNDPIIDIENLTVGYGQKEVLSDLNLQLKVGELTCLLGPNGSGKSTLIRSITGVQKSLHGSVKLNDQKVSGFSQKELAKQLSLVLTDNQAPGNLTVFALVSLGRFPYTSWLGTLSKEDKDLIYWALEATGMTAFANRHLGELSDGEKQKVMIARALAQETDLLILDEPTAHLDTPNRIEIFHLLKELSQSSGKSILVSIHDLSTALSYADKLWLIENRNMHIGIPEDLVLGGQLEAAFKTDAVEFNYLKGAFERNSQRVEKLIKVSGDEMLCFWLKNALERQGYKISEHSQLEIIAEGKREAPHMRIAGASGSYNSIEKLLEKLIDEET